MGQQHLADYRLRADIVIFAHKRPRHDWSCLYQPHEPFPCPDVPFRIALIASATNDTKYQPASAVLATILSTLLAYGMVFHLGIASFTAGYAASARNLLDEH